MLPSGGLSPVMREEIFAFVVHDKIKIKVSHDNFHFFYLLLPRASFSKRDFME
jgi:hypothetical protein